MKKKYTILLLSFFSYFIVFSADKTFTGPGNFSDATKWGGSLPVAGDNLFINGTCTFDNAANNLAYGSLSNGNTVAGTINWPVLGTNTLSVTDLSSAKAGSLIDMTNGGFLQIRASWSTKFQTFTPGIGTVIWNVTTANSALPNTLSTYFNLITASATRIVSTGGATLVNNNLTVSTGTLNFGNSNFTCNNTVYITSVLEDNSNAGNNTINHLVINAGGKLNSTISETYSIAGNLTMLGGNILGAGIPIFNVAGNFLVLGGINDIGNSQLAVAGTSSLSAALNISTIGGTKTLKDLIVTSAGSFSCGVAESWDIGGNVTVNGMFNANAGTYSLTGAGKTISGTSAITFSNVTCTGTYTNNNTSLTINGSLIGAGTWAQGPTGVLNLAVLSPSLSVTNFNASAIGNTVNYSLAGNQTIRNPTDGSYYHLSASTSGTKTFSVSTIVGGNMSITTSTLDVSISNFNISVGGNWVNTVGTFVPRSALVTFNGLGSQTIFKSGGEIFNNITFSNTGNKSLLSAISGNTLIINAGSLTANSNSITLTGNWTNNGGTFVGGTGTVLFTAATPQTIFKATGETFNDITFSNAGNKSLLSAISCNTLTINTATLIANNNNITLTGNWANNTGLFTPGTSTVFFTGTTGQTIFKAIGEVFNNITFSNSGNKTLLCAVLANTVTINAGSLTANSNSITLTGDWTNNGGTFAAGAGTVFFTGTTTQSIFKASGETFNDITFSNTGTKSLLSAISGKTLTINSTILTANSNSITLTGNWANNAGTFNPGTGTTLFTGTTTQTILKTGGETFYNITFLNAGNKSLLCPINGNTLTINAGSLTANSNTITLTGDWTNNGGTFVGGTGTVFFTGVTPQSIFKAAGETFYNITFLNSGNKSLLSSISGNTLTINAGSLTANSNSITLIGNWTNNGGTFVGGTGTVLFTAATPQTIFKASGETFNNITFSNAGTKSLLSAISCNTLTINTATLIANNYNISVTGNWANNTGLFTPGTNTVLFTGTAGQTIFKSGGEIFNNITFSNTGNKSLLSAISGNTLTINAGFLTANSNSITLTGDWINNGGTFVGGTGTVLFNGSTPQTIFKASGETFNDITFSNTGTKALLSAINGNTLTINATILTANSNSITLTGNWANNAGTFVPGTGTTLFTGTTAQTILKAGGETFYDITFLNAGNKTLLSAITANTVTINAGTFTAGSNSITLTGDWTNNGGTFAGGTGTVFFIGTTLQNIFKATGETFNNITLLNSGNKSLLSAISGNTLTINATTLTANSNSITLIGNWANIAGTFIPGTGTTLFIGTTAQSILKAGGETFYDITFSNAGNKSLLCPITGNTLTINGGILTSNSFSISLTGDWKNNGGTFSPGTGTTFFNAATAQTIFKSGGEIFNNLDFSNSGSKTLLSAITGSNVLINAGSLLDVNTTNNQISVKGNLTNNGTLTTQKGLVLFNGTVAQNIGGTSITNFYNLSLNNAAGASLGNAQNLINALTLSNGTFNTNAQVFTMISTASNTARIAPITGTGDIIGNVTVQRFAPGGSTGWALIGTPISSALTFQSWNDNFAISCASCPNGSNGGFTSIYSYNEAATGSYSASTAYVPISSITNPIVQNKGYWVYLGNGQTSTTPITIDVTGSVRKFSNVISLTKTTTGLITDDGWNLIHNPYPSPILWSSLRNNNPNVDNAIYGYNTDLNGGAGGSVAYVNGISSPSSSSGGMSDTIPMCQAFQVHCTASTNLTALESHKAAANPTFLKTSESSQITASLQLLRINLNGPTSFHDETVLYIQSGATNGFDAEYDAIKMAGQDPNAPQIMLENGSNDFQINGVSPITSSFTMPLKTTTGYAGTYTINASNINSFPTGACISLYDSFNGTTTNLKTSSYVFTLTTTTSNPRFVLNITVNPLDITTNLSQPTCVDQNAGEITAVGNNSGPWNYLWKDGSGNLLKTSLNKNTADTLSNLIGGNYSLEINTVGQCDNHDSTFTVDVMEIASAQFTSVDTTYLSNSGMVAFTNSSSNAVSNSWDFGDSFGFSFSTDPTYNYNLAGNYTVTLIATSNSGCKDTAYKSIIVISDMIVTKILSQDEEGTLILKTLDLNQFLLSGVIDGYETLNFRVVDGSGKLIKDYGNFKSDAINLFVNLNNYQVGIYYLNISGEKLNKTIKLPVR